MKLSPIMLVSKGKKHIFYKNQKIFSKKSHIKSQIKIFFKKSLFLVFIFSPIIFPSIAFATAFDVQAAGKAMFNPIISFIDTWYGTGIFAAGVSGAVVASGDLRTRALGFGIGSVVSGLTLLGVKAGFNVKTVMIYHYYNFA